MTLLAERPATPETATGATAAGTAIRGGSYVTLPAGSTPARVEGTYVSAAGLRNRRPATRGSYVTVAGAPAVATGRAEGNYVTLPAAA
ncbi:hypothetical protein J2S98_003621 [Arthrobacter oryzae]|uniref:hypothetical protein n=1 Tax=Arthrobacter oryzae TaxID=409290 RepID=UPI00277E3A6E|nr:hypothetical protein [Arthrobacter oryzae]MDP9988435.1 hypothetical protein [Arthrobacter oryzae]